MTKKREIPALSERIVAVRSVLGLRQKTFAARLGISPGYLSLLEMGQRVPSDTLLRLMTYEFGINKRWLVEGNGSPFQPEVEQKIKDNVGQKAESDDSHGMHKNIARDALVAAAILGPVMPFLSGSIAVGVGAAAILNKLCKAYGAENVSKLAKDHLKVDRSTINYWIKTDKIPQRILNQSIEETTLSAEDIDQAENFLLISKDGFAKLMKELCRDVSGGELTDEAINDLFEKSKITKENM